MDKPSPLTASCGCLLKNGCKPNTALCMHTWEKFSIKYESVCWVSMQLWFKYHSKCKIGSNLCLVNSIWKHKSQFTLTVLGYIVRILDNSHISAESLVDTTCPLYLMPSMFLFTLVAWVCLSLFTSNSFLNPILICILPTLLPWNCYSPRSPMISFLPKSLHTSEFCPLLLY